MEKIQTRLLRMVLDDYESDYETLLQKAKMQTLYVSRIKALVIEIYNRYKTLHSLNPSYVSEIFKENSKEARQLRSKCNLTMQRYNTATSGKIDSEFSHQKFGINYPENLKRLKI